MVLFASNLNDKEQFAIEVFKRNHRCTIFTALRNTILGDKKKKDIENEIFDIIETNTGIGTKILIKCKSCKTTWDITDYSVW